MWRYFFFIAFLCALCQPTRAAINWTGNVDPNDPTAWTEDTDAYVGNTSNGTITVDAGSELLSDDAYVGNESGVSGEVTVQNSGSSWNIDRNLYLGYDGSSTLSIADDGNVFVDGFSTYLGYNSGASGQATVSGTGSAWNNDGRMYLGYSGDATLDISGSGEVTSNNVYLGYNSEASGQATVDGPGSIWDINWVYLGRSGDGTIEVSNGAELNSASSFLGSNSGSTGVATVSGNGSVWNNYSLYVGSSGHGTLTINDGAEVNNSSFAYIATSHSSQGEVSVTGAGSTWTVGSDLDVGHNGQATLQVSAGGTVTVEEETWVARYQNANGEIQFDTGTLTTAGLAADFNDLSGTGTVNAKGLVVDTDLQFDATHGFNQTFVVNDLPDQNVTINLAVDGSSIMGAGYTGTGSTTVADGVELSSSDAYLGYKEGSNGTAYVDGAGSKWDNNGIFYVGHDGTGVIEITNGGRVESRSGYIGYRSDSSGEVVVDGSNSSWNTNFDARVGSSGSGLLTISNGAVANIGRDTIVSRYGSSNGEIHFDNGTLDTGGLLASFDDLSGTGTINANGLVSDVDLLFDSTHGTTQSISINQLPGQNIALNLNVDGTGSIGAGYAGTGSISIADGVVVKGNDGYLGYKSGSQGTATVNGAGSAWNLSGTLHVGNQGTASLAVTAGATVTSSSGTVGSQSPSNSEVIVEGAGSTWTNSAEIIVGDSGNGSLTIEDEGTVDSGDLHVGDYGSGALTVRGAMLNIQSKFHVGGSNSFNDTKGRAVFSDGATVTSGYTTIIEHSGSDLTEYQVTVSGSGTSWTNLGNIYVGASNSSFFSDTGHGSLEISDGASVTSANGYLGNSGYRELGRVVVRGIDTSWDIDDQLLIGSSRSQGILSIEGGASVTAHNSFVGGYGSYYPDDPTSQVIVEGVDSTWSLSGNLDVGDYYGGEVSISLGGLVSVARELGASSFNSFIDMSAGGMLALAGDADDSLSEFLSLTTADNALRYWNEGINDWSLLTSAHLRCRLHASVHVLRRPGWLHGAHGR